MKATVDANILFASLVKEGTTRKIWFNPGLRLFAPEFIIVEFLKYKKTIERKSGLGAGEFRRLLELAVSQIHLIPDRDLKPYLSAAASLSDDAKDWLYLACALKEDSPLWTNDNGFRKQKRVKTRTTEEMVKGIGQL